MGEHAAVYGRPAVVAAIDRRMHLELEVSAATQGGPEPCLSLSLPQVDVQDTWSWHRLATYAQDRRLAWQKWSEDPQSFPFPTVLGSDPAHLIRVAVGETLLHLGKLPARDARLHMHSEIPLGSGFGSSAAASVVVVRALLELLGADADDDLVGRLALQAERRQHGAPSGIDTTTVIHGGALWVEKRQGRLQMEPIKIKESGLIDRFRIFHSGAPGQSTGEVVAAVRALRDEDPAAFDHALDQASGLTGEFRGLLQTSDQPAEARALALIQGFGAWLEGIGVVPTSVTEVVRAVESIGGAAKISGAGALSGPGAGSLLIFHPQPEKLDNLPVLQHLERLDLKLGAPGLRIERRISP